MPPALVWGWRWGPETDSGGRQCLREALAFPLWLWAPQLPASGEPRRERPRWQSGALEPASRKSAVWTGDGDVGRKEEKVEVGEER